MPRNKINLVWLICVAILTCMTIGHHLPGNILTALQVSFVAITLLGSLWRHVLKVIDNDDYGDIDR